MQEIDEETARNALNRVAATQDGQIVLFWLKTFCRYDDDIVVTGDPVATYAQAAMRRLYLQIRQHTDPEHIKQVEFNYTWKVNNDRGSPTNTWNKRTRKPSAATKQ